MARMVWVVLGLAVLAYAGICALLYLQQRQLIYYPAFTRVPPEQTNFSLQRDDATLRGWIVNPGQVHAVLYFGGNGESIQGNRELFRRALPHHTIYLLAYRGYGASDGEPSEPTLTADALALFDHVQSLHPGQPVSVIGRSLGSGVASYVAGHRPVAKLVLVTPFDSLADVARGHYPWLPVQWLLRDRYPSTERLKRYDGPILVVRAGKDEVIPPANTDALIASLKQAPTIAEQASAGHNSLDDAAYGTALADFLD